MAEDSRLSLQHERGGGGDRSAMAGADEQRAVAEVQGQILMARRFPRDLEKARDNILVECRRLGLAEDALYAYPRGDETIEGPSIRLAEVLARHWGNMSSGILELAQHSGMSDVEAFCWDLETNNRWSVKFVVPHVRYTRTKGRVKLGDDPRDVYEMVANLGSRRLRACILRAIPGDVVDEAVNECKKTIQVNAGPLADRIAKMVERFDKMGVPKASIEKLLGHNVDACKEPELRRMTSAFNAIKDGFTSKESIFSDMLPPGALSDEEAAAGARTSGPAMPEEERPDNDRIDPKAKISKERDEALQKILQSIGVQDAVMALLKEFKIDETFDLTNEQFQPFMAKAIAAAQESKPPAEEEIPPTADEKAAADALKEADNKAKVAMEEEREKQQAAADAKKKKAPEPAAAPAQESLLGDDGEKLIDKTQQKEIFAVGTKAGLVIGDTKKIIKEIADVDTSAHIKVKFYETIIERLKKGK